jgi:hypothetical protein
MRPLMPSRNRNLWTVPVGVFLLSTALSGCGGPAGNGCPLPSIGGPSATEVRLPTHSSAVWFGLGSVWAVDWLSPRRTITQVAPDGRVVRTGIPLGTDVQGISVGEGAIWATVVPPAPAGRPEPSSLERIDAQSGLVSGTISLGPEATEVVTGFGGVWIANPDAGSVSRMDPRTLRILATIPVGPGPGPMVTFTIRSPRVHRSSSRSCSGSTRSPCGRPRELCPPGFTPASP